jgi:hypothetical protein
MEGGWLVYGEGGGAVEGEPQYDPDEVAAIRAALLEGAVEATVFAKDGFCRIAGPPDFIEAVPIASNALGGKRVLVVPLERESDA